MPPPDCRRVVIRLCYGIKTAPPGHEPYQRSAPESVLAGVMQRDAEELSATGGTGHLLHLWSVATRQAMYPNINEQIKARLTDSEAWRYEASTPAMPRSSGSAPCSSPGTTSPRLSARSPPRR
jgi:hypothetical protein